MLHRALQRAEPAGAKNTNPHRPLSSCCNRSMILTSPHGPPTVGIFLAPPGDPSL
jgi:hypothetical protein